MQSPGGDGLPRTVFPVIAVLELWTTTLLATRVRWSRGVPFVVCVCLLSLERQLESGKCRACWLASEGQQGKCLDVFCAHLQLWQCSRRVPCLCTYTGFVLGVGDSHSHLLQLGSGEVLQHPLSFGTSKNSHHSSPPTPARQQKGAASQLTSYIRVQQWHLSVPPSRGSISSIPCPSSWWLQINK